MTTTNITEGDRLVALEREIEAIKAATAARESGHVHSPMLMGEDRRRAQRELERQQRFEREAAEVAARERVQTERDASKRAGLDDAFRVAAERIAHEYVEHERRLNTLAAEHAALNHALGQFALRARAAGVEKPLPPVPKWRAPR
jgi:hypothetical protein